MFVGMSVLLNESGEFLPNVTCHVRIQDACWIVMDMVIASSLANKLLGLDWTLDSWQVYTLQSPDICRQTLRREY